MSVKLMVLSVIHREKQAHGYRVYRELKAWRAETWSKVRPGSIYHAINRLHLQGFIESVGSSHGEGPKRTHYRVTPNGHDLMRHLIEKALVSYDIEEFAAGLATMHELPRARVIELAKERHQSHADVTAFLESLPRDPQVPLPSQHPEIVGVWEHFFASTTEWQTGFVRRLEAGKYVFKDEA